MSPPPSATAAPDRPAPTAGHVAALADFVARHHRLFVLTGAGISTGSGIPDYRDGDGAWKRAPPVDFRAFVTDPAVRRRYWARSLLGWPAFADARPNRGHAALAALERAGRVTRLVTQNVDGLHQRAGSRRVLDLHGRLDGLVCLACRRRQPRHAFQQELAARNPEFATRRAQAAPDGDADLDDADFERFDVPACPACGGLLKPDVVFFGEGVPRDRVDAAFAALDGADGMLVAGSSLMLFSGFRFVRAAAARGLPVAALNRGRTRADDLLTLKVEAECGAALGAVVAQLGLNVR